MTSGSPAASVRNRIVITFSGIHVLSEHAGAVLRTYKESDFTFPPELSLRSILTTDS